MNTVLGKITLFTILNLATAFASAQSNCISEKDMVEISEHFTQVENFLNDKKEYCQSDLSSDWLKIINSLVVLKNIQPNEPKLDQNDFFTHKAISENNWWAYFTNRAHKITIEPENSRFCEGAVAFVFSHGDFGNIHLCRPFFQQTSSDQASTMMHEVRHFDNKGHVTCTRGAEKGKPGACDSSVQEKGSYAISVQALVGLARSKDTPESEKPILEASALYMAFNRFNSVPKVSLKNSILLSNHSGEVYNWRLEENDVEHITNLPSPAKIKNSFNNFTIYPLDPNLESYRVDKNFSKKLPSPGLFAIEYNKKSVAERAAHQSISYFGTGGLLKENKLTTLCNNKSLESDDVSMFGDIKRIVSLSIDAQDTERVSALLTEKGELIAYNCKSRSRSRSFKDSDEVIFEKLDINFPKELSVSNSFGLAGRQYGILDSGELIELSLNESSNLVSEEIILPTNNQNWVSATPLSTPEVF